MRFGSLKEFRVNVFPENLLSLFHLVIQIEPAGSLVAKFLENGVVGIDLDLVLAWFENHIAQPGFSAVVQILVVAQNLMDLVAMITLGSEDRFSTCMTA